MNQSQWVYFVKKLQETNTRPIIAAILTKVRFIKSEGSFIYISCPTTGMFYFLQSKKGEIEKEAKVFFGKPISIIFELEKTNKGLVFPSTLNMTNKNKKDEKNNNKKGGFAYDFNSFAVSKSNQLAYSAALAVVKNPGTTYNPLFLYGGTGVGKTHLSQAIASKLIEINPSFKVVYCSSEEFTNDLIESIRTKSVFAFKKKYRKLNALIIDDIQFIAGKESVQEEFFHTFNAVVSSGGQTIITSDRHPKEIRRLEDRLRSRFSGGLTVDIQPPDFELRTAIVLIKAKARNIDIDIETAKAIAENVTDTRELEGRLLEYYSEAIRSGSPITTEIIKKHIEEKIIKNHQSVKPQDILRVVSVFYDVPVSVLRGSSRKESVSFPRQVCMYLLRSIKRCTFDEIAFFLKRKDHTTVLHGVSKIESLVLKNPKIKEDISKITESIYSSS